MPTENRSSNTESLPCPFCAGRVDPEGWLRGDGTRGPECESCGATAPTLSVWNSANPTTQPHPNPIAWMVGTAFWWTKEEAERDAAETGLPIVGLGPMTDASEVERLVAANTEYARRHLEHQGEVGRLREENAELVALVEQQGLLLSETAIALRGPEPPKTRYSHADIPSRVKAAVQQIAERDALLKEVLIKTDKWMLPDLYERIRLSFRAASAEPEATS